MSLDSRNNAEIMISGLQSYTFPKHTAYLEYKFIYKIYSLKYLSICVCWNLCLNNVNIVYHLIVFTTYLL